MGVLQAQLGQNNHFAILMVTTTLFRALLLVDHGLSQPCQRIAKVLVFNAGHHVFKLLLAFGRKRTERFGRARRV